MKMNEFLCREVLLEVLTTTNGVAIEPPDITILGGYEQEVFWTWEDLFNYIFHNPHMLEDGALYVGSLGDDEPLLVVERYENRHFPDVLDDVYTSFEWVVKRALNESFD